MNKPTVSRGRARRPLHGERTQIIYSHDDIFLAPGEPVTILRDGPNGERGGLEPWMASYLDSGILLGNPDADMLGRRKRMEKIATAIRAIMEAE